MPTRPTSFLIRGSVEWRVQRVPVARLRQGRSVIKVTRIGITHNHVEGEFSISTRSSTEQQCRRTERFTDRSPWVYRAVYGSFTLGLPSGLRIVHPGFTELRSAPPMRTNAENGRLAVGLTPRSGWRVADITRGEVSPRSSRVTSWPCMCL